MHVRTFEAVSNALTSSHPDQHTYTFVKELGVWYIDLPEYLNEGGRKEDLRMRAGTNKLLSLLAPGQKRVTLTIDTAPFADAEVLALVDICEEPQGGAIYLMETCNGREVSTLLWICDIALFVFGDTPERIYFKKKEDLTPPDSYPGLS